MNNNNNKTILVVDDNTDIVDGMKNILEDEGYKVVTAFDGFEGVKKFKQEHIDLVLLDIKMPKLGGREAYREMRSLDAQMPIIIVTGSMEEESRDNILKEGVDGVIFKPFEVDTLLNIIKEKI